MDCTPKVRQKTFGVQFNIDVAGMILSVRAVFLILYAVSLAMPKMLTFGKANKFVLLSTYPYFGCAEDTHARQSK